MRTTTARTVLFVSLIATLIASVLVSPAGAIGDDTNSKNDDKNGSHQTTDDDNDDKNDNDDNDDKAHDGDAYFTLTIRHNNDGESSLLPVEGDDGALYGGAARFFRKVRSEARQSYKNWDEGESWNRGTVLLNSGDNFLAGTTFEAGRQDGAPFYDAEFVRMLRYDALAVGNHEFDFGPEVFAEFVEGVQRAKKTTRFVSANLDYGNEPSLAPFIGDELVAGTIIREKGNKIGVVGLTTDSLPSISSPGFVEVSSELVALAQAEIDRLTAKGAKIIILVSHLQGLESELELVGQLSGIDVVIGGGGDELLADETTQLAPGDEDEIFGAYPQIATSADGAEVPVVTTPGNYTYVGVLEVTFDKHGNIIKIDTEDSGLKVVTDTGPEAVKAKRKIERLIEEPVAAFIEDLATTIIGSSEVALDCERVEVRGVESNCGNLIADAHLAAGVAEAAALGLDTPQLGLQNGGGIRGEIDQPAGPISIADTFRLQPFGNFVAVAEDVPAEAVRQILEEGAIRLPEPGDGGFTQVSDGTVVVYDSSFPARDADQSTGEEFAPGQRVRELILADGTVVVTGGVTQDVTVDLVQLSFSITGGDAQPDLSAIPGVTVTILPISDQQSLQSYIEGDLGGVVGAADYPVGGEGRITIG